MREIKFRVWDKKAKKMRYSNKFMIRADGTLLYNKKTIECGDEYYNELEYLNENRYEIIESTGLKDKNGNEIYEGDIVKIRAILVYERDTWDGESGEYSGRQQVEEEVECIRVINSMHTLIYLLNPNWVDFEMEVIGNKYENPELLER